MAGAEALPAERSAARGALICPCCGGRFERFLPAGSRRKVPNRKCPGCGSLERHRAIWLYMLNRTNLMTARLRVLHFAPLPALGDLLAAMDNVEHVTADLDSPRAALHMDITDILFRDEVFDAVLCVHVLEHVEDDRAAMREVFRVLRPGGWAILHSPVDRTQRHTLEDPSVTAPEDRERLFGQKDHVRAYGRDYADRLTQAGFCVMLDSYLRRLGPEVAERHRLGRELEIYFCLKPGRRPTRET
jgi:SAM-dependent methyltransferase